MALANRTGSRTLRPKYSPSKRSPVASAPLTVEYTGREGDERGSAFSGHDHAAPVDARCEDA